jgi:hypothetical protein
MKCNFFRVFYLVVIWFSFLPNLSANYNNPTCQNKHCTYYEDDNNITKEQYIELKEKIISVQNENDKRFEVLLWGIGIIVTLLLAINIYSYFNNRTIAAQNAKDTAKEEFIREYKIYKRKFNEMLRDINAKKVEVENLKLEFEYYQASVKQASVVSNNIEIKKSNEDGNSK